MFWFKKEGIVPSVVFINSLTGVREWMAETANLFAIWFDGNHGYGAWFNLFLSSYRWYLYGLIKRSNDSIRGSGLVRASLAPRTLSLPCDVSDAVSLWPEESNEVVCVVNKNKVTLFRSIRTAFHFEEQGYYLPCSNHFRACFVERVRIADPEK